VCVCVCVEGCEGSFWFHEPIGETRGVWARAKGWRRGGNRKVRRRRLKSLEEAAAAKSPDGVGFIGLVEASPHGCMHELNS
jgi:hypothetical protein